MQADAAVSKVRAAERPVRLAWWEQFWLLLRLQFSEYKDTAVFLAMFSLVMPLGLMWLMGPYVAGQGPQAAWFLAGNAVMTVGFGSANFAVQRVGLLRINKEMDFYAALPVSRLAFVATIFALSQVSALPGMIASMVLGHFLLAVPWSSIVAGIPLSLLTAICLTVVGTYLGTLGKSWGTVNLVGNLLYFVVMFLSPVFVPYDRLALPLKAASWLLPTGQGALALTDALAGQFGMRFWLCTALLLAWTLASGILGLRNLDFRND